MRPLLLLPHYFAWHYSQALVNILSIIRNFVWFCGHLFSIKILFLTLFSPWQRMQEERKPGMQVGEIFGNMAVNVLMRIAGAVIRLTMIGIGLLFIAVILVVGAVFFVLWLAFPIAIIFSIGLGFTFLFS